MPIWTFTFLQKKRQNKNRIINNDNAKMKFYVNVQLRKYILNNKPPHSEAQVL